MIPGLEYEEPQATSGGGVAESPSASVQSIDMSSPHNTNDHTRFHLQELHRRRPHTGSGYTNSSNGGGSSHHNGGSHHTADPDDNKYAKRSRVVKKLDIFPKTERDYTVRTERGGQLTAVGYAIMAILILAEFMTWRGLNKESLEHIVVDTR